LGTQGAADLDQFPDAQENDSDEESDKLCDQALSHISMSEDNVLQESNDKVDKSEGFGIL